MAEEWSEWFLHDGDGCPVPDGTVVEVLGYQGPWPFGRYVCKPGIARAYHTMWSDRTPNGDPQIIRYRIRKPRGLTILQELIEQMPETVEA